SRGLRDRRAERARAPAALAALRRGADPRRAAHGSRRQDAHDGGHGHAVPPAGGAAARSAHRSLTGEPGAGIRPASGGAAVAATRGFRSGLALAEARLERAHETAHLRLTLDPGRADRLARRLALDDVQEDLAVGVLVALRVPVGGERLDQAQGQLELAAIARGRG